MIEKLKYRLDVKDENLDSVNKIRKQIGLKIIRRGNRECLKCSKDFYSRDLANNKICDQCLNDIERIK